MGAPPYLTEAGGLDTVLTEAVLTCADLAGARLLSAILTGADLDGAKWSEGGAQVPDGWMVDSESGRLKRAGQLSEIAAHYL